MLYAVVTYVNMRGIRAVDRIVELCGRDLAFICLTWGQKSKKDAFYEFKDLRGSQWSPPHKENAPCISQRLICVAQKYGEAEKTYIKSIPTRKCNVHGTLILVEMFPSGAKMVEI